MIMDKLRVSPPGRKGPAQIEPAQIDAQIEKTDREDR
jgi:hypothetical protein